MVHLIFYFGLLFRIGSILDSNITGTYSRRIQRNSDIRQFGSTITLNCDCTVIATFRGDMMNEKVKGYWSIKEDILKVVLEEPLGHWPKENLFN